MNDEILQHYLDNDGRLTLLPKKRSRRLAVLAWLAEQLPDGELDEVSVNAAIQTHISFPDYVTARRDMVDAGYVTRTSNGRTYRRVIELDE